ncbi:MAG: Si-specific NAD(P)(+) transhydrogenase [Proteobacteria bacterium]|nr:Si-specific NAD(P)(+) transhydrogenase [Pseudomonadota bacterium]
MRKYDILVIGSGPGGEKAAIQGAKLGKKVAIIERSPFIGGAGINTGTLPSKTLRETALYLAGLRQRSVFGIQVPLGRDIRLGELMHKKTEVIKKQMEIIAEQLSRNNVDIVFGTASFKDEHTVVVTTDDGAHDEYSGDMIVISTGTSPARPEDIPFDAEHIYDSDTILELDRIPPTMTVIGAGVIGCEYACIFASLGVKVTLVEKRSRLLGFADEEIITSLMYWMRHTDITVKLNEEVVKIEVEAPDRVKTSLKSGKSIMSEKLLYTMGRSANVEALNLDAIGVAQGKRGLIEVSDSFQTSVGHIYAVGDVIGFPSLAATSREQGRRAVCNAYEKEGVTCDNVGLMPFGIYTIPEISMVGATEEELTEKGVPYEVGTAFFEEVARGLISGDLHGMLKLIFNSNDHTLLGVHIIGEKASELIHVGQAVMNYGGQVDYFKDVVFNHPTLSEAYKVAALNGLNKL